MKVTIDVSKLEAESLLSIVRAYQPCDLASKVEQKREFRVCKKVGDEIRKVLFWKVK